MPEIIHVPEFDKDLKKFKFDISEDLKTFKKALLGEYPAPLSGVVMIPGFGKDFYPVYKAKKFRCKTLKRGSKSGVRVIYTINPKEKEIKFIEIYFKGKKENHDLKRIRKYLIKKT